FDPRFTERGAHLVGAVAMHDDGLARIECESRIEHVREQWAASDRVQDFGQLGPHALALTRGKHYPLERHRPDSRLRLFGPRRGDMDRIALVCGALISLSASQALAQDSCSHRGELDALYCDENRDLVADPPKDPRKFKNPSTLVFTYTPVEDPAVYENAFKPFTDYLAKCTAKRVVFYQVQSNAAEIEAMRSGRLHVGGFSTGPTAFAVNLAGAVPFAVKGTEKEFQGYNLIVIVKASSPYQKLADLTGKKVDHASPSSNSGHLAPMALFPG